VITNLLGTILPLDVGCNFLMAKLSHLWNGGILFVDEKECKQCHAKEVREKKMAKRETEKK